MRNYTKEELSTWRVANRERCILHNIRGRCILHNIRGRCIFKPSYKNIHNYLTLDDIKILWLDYGAETMKAPELHRIKPEGDYTFTNCKFIEASEHKSIPKKPKDIPEEAEFV